MPAHFDSRLSIWESPGKNKKIKFGGMPCLKGLGLGSAPRSKVIGFASPSEVYSE
jgi:hypothetical protein